MHIWIYGSQAMHTVPSNYNRCIFLLTHHLIHNDYRYQDGCLVNKWGWPLEFTIQSVCNHLHTMFKLQYHHDACWFTSDAHCSSLTSQVYIPNAYTTYYSNYYIYQDARMVCERCMPLEFTITSVYMHVRKKHHNIQTTIDIMVYAWFTSDAHSLVHYPHCIFLRTHHTTLYITCYRHQDVCVTHSWCACSSLLCPFNSPA